MQQTIYYNQDSEDEAVLNINIYLFKCLHSLWQRKYIIMYVFIAVFLFFVLKTFISSKVWQIDADLYINKSNSSNMMEVNPYFIEEAGITGNMSAALSGGSLLNEIELMKSPLVLDKVIRDNDLRFKKLFGIFTTQKTGEYLTAEKFIKKGPKIEIKKGTNVVSISYKNKDRDLAYNVVTSLIIHYIELRKEIAGGKSKADKKILEAEYNKAKTALEDKLKTVRGLPLSSLAGSANLAAMSAFSKSAREAISSMQGQYAAGEKSQIAVKEDAEKITRLAAKLQWAELVDEISDSSKVILLKEPKQLRNWEYASPKLFTNIILGILFGIITALIAAAVSEMLDKKLTYLMLGNEIIFDSDADLFDLKKLLLSNNDKQLTVIAFNSLSNHIMNELQKYGNINFVNAELTENFAAGISKAENMILFVSIGKTDTKLYKSIKEILSDKNKKIIKEVLV